MLASLGALNASAGSPSVEDASKTIRVSTTGTDATGCGDGILPPCKSIQYAVNQALTGDTILVAAGVYKYNSIDPCTALSTRSVVCYWSKQLTILGGYTDANWITADPVANLTVIDGEGQYRGLAMLGNSGTTSLRMEGITIQNGHAVGDSSGVTYTGHAFGAGMWASKSSVNLKNMIFKNNIAAGGSSMNYASAGWAFGGGLAIEGPAAGSSTLEKITFTGNQALGGSGSNGGGNTEGGALFAGEAIVTAREITLTNNLAKGGDTPGNGCSAAGSGYGGAVSSPTIIDLDRQTRPVGLAPDMGAYEYSIPTLKAEKPVVYVMTDDNDILSLLDLVSVTTGPVIGWEATTNFNWVYLGASGTSQQTSGQTGSNLTIRFDPSKIALGFYVVTINLTSNSANPTSITIYFYKVDHIEMMYLPSVSK